MKDEIGTLEFLVESYEGLINTECVKSKGESSNFSIKEIINLEHKIKLKLEVILKAVELSPKCLENKCESNSSSPITTHLAYDSNMSKFTNKQNFSVSTNEISENSSIDISNTDLKSIYNLVNKFLANSKVLLKTPNRDFLNTYKEFKKKIISYNKDDITKDSNSNNNDKNKIIDSELLVNTSEIPHNTKINIDISHNFSFSQNLNNQSLFSRNSMKKNMFVNKNKKKVSQEVSALKLIDEYIETLGDRNIDNKDININTDNNDNQYEEYESAADWYDKAYNEDKFKNKNSEDKRNCCVGCVIF